MDPDTLTFFAKTREHESFLFLLFHLLHCSQKITLGTWSQSTDFSKSDQKIPTLTAST
jgi:hypothetical protein